MGTVKGRQQGKARDTGGQSKVESMAWDRVKTTMDIKEITRFGKGDGKITGLWKQAMVRMRAMFVWENNMLSKEKQGEKMVKIQKDFMFCKEISNIWE